MDLAHVANLAAHKDAVVAQTSALTAGLASQHATLTTDAHAKLGDDNGEQRMMTTLAATQVRGLERLRHTLELD